VIPSRELPPSAVSLGRYGLKDRRALTSWANGGAGGPIGFVTTNRREFHQGDHEVDVT